MHPHYTHRLINDAQENNCCLVRKSYETHKYAVCEKKIIVFTVEAILVTMLIKSTMPHVQ